MQNLTAKLSNGVPMARGTHGISEKKGEEATASFAFPNIHPWACKLVLISFVNFLFSYYNKCAI